MAEHDRENEAEQPLQPRPFWSGVVAFGLVSLPVSLFPANRGKPFALKMIDQNGTPLSRSFFCEREQALLSRDEIIRGYEVEKDQYVIVDDRELEALAPEKSREIDLRRFVALSDIDPIYFERGYFLVPDSGTTKAYRLLAKSMEDQQRAGIATFVMRNKEYIIAIIAERGILRAETLRFHHEIRSPQSVGLPSREHAEKERVQRIRQAIQALSVKELDRSEIKDYETQRVLERVNAKLEAGEDVVQAPEEFGEEDEETNVIDLMAVLKERLQGRKRTREKSDKGRTGLESLSRDELYDRARKLNIPRRSGMSKERLIQALSQD